MNLMCYCTLQKFHLIHPLLSRLSPSWGESKTYPSCQWCSKLNWCACSDATMLCEGGQTIAETRNNCPDNKTNIAWCCTKVWRKSNFIQHHATLCNIVQQGGQTDATCCVQQCYTMLHEMLHPFDRGLRLTWLCLYGSSWRIFKMWSHNGGWGCEPC